MGVIPFDPRQEMNSKDEMQNDADHLSAVMQETVSVLIDHFMRDANITSSSPGTLNSGNSTSAPILFSANICKHMLFKKPAE